MHQSNQKTWAEPDEWEFDNLWQKVQDGFWLWSMSGFQRLPTQDEIDAYDPRWVSDMRLAHSLYSFQGNNSAPQQMLEQYLAFRDNPEAYKAKVAAEKAAMQYDGANGAGNDGAPLGPSGARSSGNMRSPL